MKIFLRMLICLVFIAMMLSCSTGYISSPEAERLKKYIEPEILLELTQNPNPDIWIIDVRPAGAYRSGHIPSAKNYPSSEIMQRLNEIPKSQYLIFYCETGGRAQSVIKKMEEKAYTLMMNWGANTRWPYEREKEDKPE
jgi:rhodanese-related sulfurtransferase